MKIIKQLDINDWSYRHTCLDCSAELEIEANDIIYNNYPGDFRESSYETYTCKCPVCTNVIIINNDKIPKLIKLNSKKKVGK